MYLRLTRVECGENSSSIVSAAGGSNISFFLLKRKRKKPGEEAFLSTKPKFSKEILYDIILCGSLNYIIGGRIHQKPCLSQDSAHSYKDATSFPSLPTDALSFMFSPHSPVKATILLFFNAI